MSYWSVDFNKKTEYAQFMPTGQQIAAVLMVADGYRQVSRKFREVARVDIPEEKAIKHLRKEFLEPEMHELTQQDADFYRRCLSKDNIENVPEEVMVLIRELSNRTDFPEYAKITYGFYPLAERSNHGTEE